MAENQENVDLTKSETCKKVSEPEVVNPVDNDAFKIPSVIQKDTKPNEPVVVEKKENIPELKYKAPWWSAIPPKDENYNLEVLKNGCIVSTINLNDKAYHVFGRLPLCDVVLEHPSISRYHALVQYRGNTDGDPSLSGFYLYDLGSTHGTVVNKSKIKQCTYYRLKVGYVIKFGGSSRLFVVQGPRDDDEEVNLQPSKIAENKAKVGQIFTDEEYDSLKKVASDSEKSEGIDWGFGEDAEEEQIDSEKFQELYSGVEFKDPKKTLRGYYEREGLELDYQVDETGPGHARVYHCRVRLPVDGPNGSAVFAEASVTGRKKDAVKECANEACKMLDAYGLLRQSSHESRKKRERNLEEDDFYESDEDNFLDRTGTIEQKRLKRMRKAGKDKSEVETYDSLLCKLEKVQKEVKTFVERIQNAEALDEANNSDSLDDFMDTMSQRMDRQTKIKLKRKIVELKKDEERLNKLLTLAKPTDLSSLQSSAQPSPIVSNVSPPTKTPGNKVPDYAMKEIAEPKNSEKHELTLRQENSSTDNHSLDANISAEKTVLKSKSSSGFAVPTTTVRPAKARTKVTTQRKDGEENQKSKSTLIHSECEVNRYSVATEDASDPYFTSWTPPEDQVGDGKTKLNEKYGY
ncbi:kanadaptin-like isoform X2 [Dendronephthya gigantea]|uniref:kanadaptin-like isoform X2 n=1 Tax=Dendronephthya gigantea TaxID=151771 RepID=UPI00106BCE66|nr:kanadaptin-like isoform X2 [Dendronephthya gigantea]